MTATMLGKVEPPQFPRHVDPDGNGRIIGWKEKEIDRWLKKPANAARAKMQKRKKTQ